MAGDCCPGRRPIHIPITPPCCPHIVQYTSNTRPTNGLTLFFFTTGRCLTRVAICGGSRPTLGWVVGGRP
jgi:hypothetical protein